MNWIIIVVIFILAYLIGNVRHMYINKQIFKLTGINPETEQQQQQLGMELVHNRNFTLPWWLWIVRLSSWGLYTLGIYSIIRKIF